MIQKRVQMIVMLTEHDLDDLSSSREPKLNSLYFSSIDGHSIILSIVQLEKSAKHR